MSNPYGGVSVTRVLSSAMRTAELNHKYLANNIANVDTPRYAAKEIDFDKTLRAFVEGRGGIALRTTRPRHLEFSSHRSSTIKQSYSSTNDFNKVDLDEEMTKLSENTGRFSLYASLLAKHTQMTRNMLSTLQR